MEYSFSISAITPSASLMELFIESSPPLLLLREQKKKQKLVITLFRMGLRVCLKKMISNKICLAASQKEQNLMLLQKNYSKLCCFLFLFRDVLISTITKIHGIQITALYLYEIFICRMFSSHFNQRYLANHQYICAPPSPRWVEV